MFGPGQISHAKNILRFRFEASQWTEPNERSMLGVLLSTPLVFQLAQRIVDHPGFERVACFAKFKCPFRTRNLAGRRNNSNMHSREKRSIRIPFEFDSIAV